MSLIESTTAEIQGLATNVWREAFDLSRQDLEDLKHDAAGRKQTDPSDFARVAAGIVEAVCICELEARAAGKKGGGKRGQ